MARNFNIPAFYRSSLITSIKRKRQSLDSRKIDLSPSEIDLGTLKVKLARHFGFCFGVENAIEIAYRAVEENPGKRVFLLSEMIHNPHVNSDLRARGIDFLQDTEGRELIALSELRPDDVVIVPAFGTTVEIFNRLEEMGIDFRQYNTTCPFVEKVWRRGAELGKKGYAIIIHGKERHEETRATFSHISIESPSLVIREMSEAKELVRYILGEMTEAEFFTFFEGRYSKGFNPERDLRRIGVVNQTTMLASETQAISDVLKQAMCTRYGESTLGDHFADTRDTLCYATSENQGATKVLTEQRADFALVVGGYNSSNTSHLVELCEQRLPTYYIQDHEELISVDQIRHLDLGKGETIITTGWLPSDQNPLEVLVTAGASCPDMLVERVVGRLAELAGVGSEFMDYSQNYLASSELT